ncbi:MAG TPA: hypothetical protein VEF76_09070 [Patescibacteria group bacterium]|nr:hypothetical protein [Patescibacteria group bacterium]
MGEKDVNDYDIQALVDAQLDWEEEKKVWQAIQANSILQRRYEELVNQKKLLLAWWASENTIEPVEKPLDHRLYAVQSSEKH